MAPRLVEKEIVHRNPVPQSLHRVSAWAPVLPTAGAGAVAPRLTAPGSLLKGAVPIDATRVIE